MRFLRATFTLLTFVLSPVALAAPCAGFTDVDDTSPFCSSVEWMRNRGITLGCAVNLYCPSDPVDRLHLAIFLDRMGRVVFQQGGNSFGAKAQLGTLDGHEVEIAVFNGTLDFTRLRLEPDTNVVLGHSGNYVQAGVLGATIGGGGAATIPGNGIRADHGTISGGSTNIIDGAFGVIGGGIFNHVGLAGDSGTVAGGRTNSAVGQASTVSGGLATEPRACLRLWVAG